MINYQIKANNIDITNKLKPYLISFEVVDVIGDKVDRLNLKLVDEKDQLAMPKTGITLSLSVFDQDKLISFGHFIVNEVHYKNMPPTIDIVAKSIPFEETHNYQSMHDQKTRALTNINLEQLLELISKEHKLSYSISPNLALKKIAHLNQVNESNLSLLRRMSREYKADLKITYQKILLIDLTKEDLESRGITYRVLNLNELNSFSYSKENRHKYGSAIVPFYSLDKGQTNEMIIGNKAPVYRANYIYESKERAKAIAENILSKQKDKKDKLSFSMVLDLLLRAGQPIKLTGLKAGIPNNWMVSQVRHQFNQQGNQTMVEARCFD